MLSPIYSSQSHDAVCIVSNADATNAQLRRKKKQILKNLSPFPSFLSPSVPHLDLIFVRVHKCVFGLKRGEGKLTNQASNR